MLDQGFRVLPENPKAWTLQEGQLAVDVYEMDTHIVIVSTIAGSDMNSIEVFVHADDVLTIRGNREMPSFDTPIIEAIHQECFWGAFSRTIVLPVHVRGEEAQASYKNGILIVSVPKQEKRANIPIEIIDE